MAPETHVGENEIESSVSQSTADVVSSSHLDMSDQLKDIASVNFVTEWRDVTSRELPKF